MCLLEMFLLLLIIHGICGSVASYCIKIWMVLLLQIDYLRSRILCHVVRMLHYSQLLRLLLLHHATEVSTSSRSLLLKFIMIENLHVIQIVNIIIVAGMLLLLLTHLLLHLWTNRKMRPLIKRTWHSFFIFINWLGLEICWSHLNVIGTGFLLLIVHKLLLLIVSWWMHRFSKFLLNWL